MAPIETITIRATNAAIKSYQQLLKAEWSGAFPRRALALLWSTLADRHSPGPLLRILNPEDSDFPLDCFGEVVARINEGTRFADRAGLPGFPSEFPSVRGESARQAGRFASYLTLRAHANLLGDIEFFMDVQGLAFQAALGFTLPALRNEEASRAILVHAAVLFAQGQSESDPAQDAYLMSEVYGYLGDEDRRLRSLHASFRFTEPSDHSYLTKAQEYWSELLDADRPAEAKKFLFSLLKRCLPSQEDEVGEMIDAASPYIFDASHRRR